MGWRAAIESFNLDDEHKLSDWVAVIDAFAKLGWGSPSNLALVSSTQLRTAIEWHAKGLAASQLWTADTLLFEDLSPASFLALKGASGNDEKLIRRLKNARLCSNAARADVKTSLNESKINNNLPNDFDKMGPEAKLNTLRKANLPLYKVNRFFRTSAQSIALTGIQRAFPGFASGIRCY